MFSKRILTALVLIIIIVAGVLLLPTLWIASLLGVISMLAIIEWADLAGVHNSDSRIAILIAFIILAVCVAWGLTANLIPILPTLTPVVLWWIIITWRINTIQSITPHDGTDYINISAGILILLSTWGSLVCLHLQPNGRWLLLFFFTLIWAADSCAYFAGHRWGTTQLAPVLSPSKTTEGVYGALISAIFWGIMLAMLSNASLVHGLWLVSLCLLTVAASVVGDLYESLLKRERGLKDSGSLLPGHGGILDRIDSVTAAAPVFALGLALLGVIK